MPSRDERRPVLRPSAPPSPRQPGRWHKLLVIPRAGEHRVIALGESVVWVWRHYLPAQRRFELCLDSIGKTCLLCQRHYGREQSGYLAVLRGHEQVTLVVTAGAWLHSRSLQTADGALRGYTVYATRLHPRANGPLRLWLPGDHTDGRRLPSAWDVIAELDVRYGLASRDGEEAEPGEERSAV